MSDPHVDQMLLYLDTQSPPPREQVMLMNGDYIEGVTEPMAHAKPPCIHLNGTSGYEDPEGTRVGWPTGDQQVPEWVRRCADCGIRIDQPGGPHQTLEPWVEDLLTGYKVQEQGMRMCSRVYTTQAGGGDTPVQPPEAPASPRHDGDPRYRCTTMSCGRLSLPGSYHCGAHQ